MATIQYLKSFSASAEGDAAKLYRNGSKAACSDAGKVKSEAGSLARLFTIERAFV